MSIQTTWNSPVGTLLIAADDGGICEIRLLGSGEAQMEEGETFPLLACAVKQLREYFAGERRTFDLPLSICGTAFEQSVWRALEAIPFGETRSYGQIAEQLGRPKAARAVGGACARNPLLIVVSCHRVIASSGALTGFAAGLEMKRRLLALEGHALK